LLTLAADSGAAPEVRAMAQYKLTGSPHGQRRRLALAASSNKRTS
jgi:hypothetical protein